MGGSRCRWICQKYRLARDTYVNQIDEGGCEDEEHSRRRYGQMPGRSFPAQARLLPLPMPRSLTSSPYLSTIASLKSKAPKSPKCLGLWVYRPKSQGKRKGMPMRGQESIRQSVGSALVVYRPSSRTERKRMSTRSRCRRCPLRYIVPVFGVRRN